MPRLTGIHTAADLVAALRGGAELLSERDPQQPIRVEWSLVEHRGTPRQRIEPVRREAVHAMVVRMSQHLMEHGESPLIFAVSEHRGVFVRFWKLVEEVAR